MKPLLLSILGLLAFGYAKAQTAGPATGTTAVNTNLPGSSQSWTGTGNIMASDDNYASFGNLPLVGTNYTDYLVVTDFHMNIPVASLVMGIKVEVEASDPNERTSDYSVRINRMGFIGTQEMSLGKPLLPTDGVIEYGGEEELWGESWTYKEINDDRFGLAISMVRNASNGVTAGRIDNITITVYYKLITLPVTLTSFTATKENKSVVLNWNTASESSMNFYVAERSSNGINFYSLGTIYSQNMQAAAYSLVDKSPYPGINYYRLKMEGDAGYKKYSPIVSVHFDKHATISLSPCPWIKGSDLFINNPQKELLRIQFYNAVGQMVSTVLTTTDKVATDNLVNKAGKFYYNVFNARNESLGSGTLVIQ
ncbi:MAG: hypothetical protein ABIT05_04015 [Chitinophagaceae bacterium]